MTREELMQVKSVIGDMRFMQASALVASKLESKESRAYMNNLAKLEKLVGNELTAVMGLEDL
jgi:hypothetical protein